MHLDNEDAHDTAPRLLRRIDDLLHIVQWLSEAAKVSCDPFRKVAVRPFSGYKVTESRDLAGAKSWAAIISLWIKRPLPTRFFFGCHDLPRSIDVELMQRKSPSSSALARRGSAPCLAPASSPGPDR